MNRRHVTLFELPAVRQRERAAFTLIELLVVVAIIVALLSILMPALGRATEAALRTQCLSNTHQLTVAWQGFTGDHFMKMPGAEHANGTYPDVENCWVLNDATPETELTLSRGSLWPYAGRQPALYRCPNENRSTYIRSYSIGTYLNGWDWVGYGSYFDPVRSFTAVVGPAQRLAFIDDSDPRGWNMGSFSKGNAAYWQSLGGPASYTWGDWPADRHGGGNVHSFADGHALFRKFTHPDTAKVAAFGTPAPSSPDFQYYVDISGP